MSEYKETDTAYEIALQERPSYWKEPEINCVYPCDKGVLIETYEGVARQVWSPLGYFVMVCHDFYEKYADKYNLKPHSFFRASSDSLSEGLRGEASKIKYYYVADFSEPTETLRINDYFQARKQVEQWKKYSS